MYLIDLIKNSLFWIVDKGAGHGELPPVKSFLSDSKARGVGAKNAPPVLPSHPSAIQPKAPQTFSGYSGIDPTEDTCVISLRELCAEYAKYVESTSKRGIKPMTLARYENWQKTLRSSARDSDGLPEMTPEDVANQLSDAMYSQMRENTNASEKR